MATTTWAVRLNDEKKKELAAQIEASGMSAAEWVAAAMAADIASAAEVRLGGERRQELDRLRHHVARIEEIYVSLLQGAADSAEQADTQIADLKARAQMADAAAHQIRTEAQEQIMALTTERDECVEQLSVVRTEAADARDHARLAHLEAQRADIRIAELERVVEDYPEQIRQREARVLELQGQLKTERDMHNRAKGELAEIAREKALADADHVLAISRLQENHAAKEERAKAEAARDIERLKGEAKTQKALAKAELAQAVAEAQAGDIAKRRTDLDQIAMLRQERDEARAALAKARP